MRNYHSCYTVYNNKTEEVVIVDGTARECAKRMGIKEESFYSIFSRLNKGKKTRWHIVKSDCIELDTSEEEEEAEEVGNSFGERVRHHRKKMGIPLEKMAKIIGIDYVTLSNYERDIHCPSLFMATCIADALGLSLDYLAGRINKEK